MADSDRTPFEVIRASQSRRDRLAAPKWWGGATEKPAPRPEADRGGRPGWLAWLTAPLTLRANLAAVLVAIAVVGAAVIVAYEVGVSRARRIAETTTARSTRLLADARNQPINHRLMVVDGEDVLESRPNVQPDDDTAAARAPAASAEQRRPGLNYYCLATMPARYANEAEKMVAFLRRNQVDAAVVSVQNDKLQLIALQGFERISSPQARRFRDRLRALGRAWKAEHGGYTDWHDMYAIKYRGD